MTLLFSPWFWLAVGVYSFALVTGGYYKGYGDADTKWALQHKKDEVESAKRLLKAQERSTVVVTQLVKGDTVIKTVFKDRVIEKVVPHEVIVESDRACGAMPVWFVELWNSANQARLPDAAKGVNGGATDVVLSDVASQHDREAELSARYELRFNSLKAWVRSQYEAINGVKAPY